jgi:TatA/E family protein of Tat protein translocase
LILVGKSRGKAAIAQFRLAGLAHAVFVCRGGKTGIIKTEMSLPDTIFIFALALVIFGPKKLPEIGRQIGKLIFEFRRASNEFKMQIEEELRAAEQEERQKKLAAEAAAQSANTNPKEAITVRPPSTGVTVSTDSPSYVESAPREVDAAGTVPSTNSLSASVGDSAGGSGNPENGYPEAVEPIIENNENDPSPEFPPAVSAEAEVAPEPTAESSANPVLNGATIETSPSSITDFSAGGLEDTARRAEEHIQEQIAIHHG